MMRSEMIENWKSKKPNDFTSSTSANAKKRDKDVIFDYWSFIIGMFRTGGGTAGRPFFKRSLSILIMAAIRVLFGLKSFFRVRIHAWKQGFCFIFSNMYEYVSFSPK